ncbi:MAG: hypothetical protein E6Q62_07025 [Nitrosomonas sp.]|nr:MAG: hypothetical protein E6Q62_07025 [Nitrosomonas sp.]
MKQSEIPIDRNSSHYFRKQEDIQPLYEAGHLRRAKMHVARFIDSSGNKQLLNSPALQQLLEASLLLETTDCDILAAYLKRPPATICVEFQKIRPFFKHQKNHLKSH